MMRFWGSPPPPRMVGEHLLRLDWPFSMGMPEPHAQMADIDPALRRRIFCDNPKGLLDRYWG
jgi:hypothetical protein